MIPPVRDFYFTPQRASFLGLRALAEIAADHGVECRVFNGTSGRGRAAPLPDEVSHLLPHLGTEGFFKRFYRFGKTPESLAGEVAAWAPDHVLVSCFAFCYATEAVETAAACRKLLPRARITLGGAGVSAYPEYFLRHSPADYAVAGEADDRIAGFLNDPLSVTGVYSREGDDIISSGTAEPPRVFSPALAAMRATNGVQYFSAMLTRGCAMKCALCSSRLQGATFRKAPLPAVDRVFRNLAGVPGRVHLDIEDDTIASDFDYLLSVLELVRKHAGGGATFSMENGVDYRTLDGHKIRVLARQGLRQLNISLVSRNEPVLSYYGRTSMPERFEEVVFAARECGIPVTAYIIAGLKGEPAESVRECLRYLSSLPVLVGISPFYPVPGIKDYQERRFFDNIPPRLCAGAAFHSWHDCSTDELVSLFREARFLNLSKHGTVARS